MYTNEEQRHIERLRKHPQLMDRFNSILDVAEADGPGVDTADAVEERTVAEVRKLGNEVMAEWASSKETASRQALKTSTPKAQPFKKN